MIGVILAAGKGTRLRPFTYFLPKPLLPRPSRSLLKHQVSFLKDLGCTKIFVTIGYRSKILSFFLRNYSFVETIEVGGGNASFLSNLIRAGIRGKIIIITSDNLMTINTHHFVNGYDYLEESFLVCIPKTMAKEGDYARVLNQRVVEICRGSDASGDYLLSGLQVINLDDLNLDLFDPKTEFHKVWQFLIDYGKLRHVSIEPSNWKAIDRPRDLMSLILSKHL